MTSQISKDKEKKAWRSASVTACGYLVGGAIGTGVLALAFGLVPAVAVGVGAVGGSAAAARRAYVRALTPS